MNKEKQIEEMARDVCNSIVWDQDGYATVECLATAKRLRLKGYCKQSEGEWIEQVRVSKEGKPLLNHYKCNLCGVYLATQANYCPNCGAKMKGGK